MRIRLVRNDPAARWRLGLLATGQGYTGRDRLILLHGPRLLGAMLLLLLAGWNASAALLWRRQQTAGYHSVSYADIALPWRWAEMRQAKSRDQIELARSLMENGDDLKALWNLLAAVHRTPANREGTRLLGIVLVRNLMVGEALDYLTKGLEHFEPDMAYMHLLLDTAAQADEHELILQLTRRFWPTKWAAIDSEHRWLLAYRQGMALVQLSRWPETVAWCRSLRELKQDPISLVDMESYALIKLGRADEARTLLRGVPLDLATRQSDLLRLLAEALYQTGDDRGFRTALLMYLQMHQGDPASYLDVLAFCADKPGLRGEFSGALRAFYHRFEKQEDALALLSGFLLTQHLTPELEQLLAQMKTEGFATTGTEAALAESLIYDGRLGKADELLHALPVLPDNTLLGFRLALLRRTLVCLGTSGPKAGITLLDYLGHRRLPLTDSLGLADLLSRHARLDTAEQILLQARQSYPHSLRLAERLSAVQAQLGSAQAATGVFANRP